MLRSGNIENKGALRVVIDTNVFISGLLNPHNSPGRIMAIIASPGSVELLVSKAIFLEYSAVIRRDRFRLSREKIDAALRLILEVAIILSPEQSFDLARDPYDNKFLECAYEGKADFLITGNKKHFPFSRFESTEIMTPAEFISFIKGISQATKQS